MVYKSLKEQCPKYFKGYFQYVNQSHSVNTRASIADLKQKNLKSKIGRSSFKYTGVEDWNKIPRDIKCAQSLNIFKNMLKHWLMGKLA